MTLLTPLMGSGMMTLVAFAVLAAFVVLGSLSLRKHIGGVEAPYEADLTPEGRAAQEFEHRFKEHRDVPEKPVRP